MCYVIYTPGDVLLNTRPYLSSFITRKALLCYFNYYLQFIIPLIIIIVSVASQRETVKSSKNGQGQSQL